MRGIHRAWRYSSHSGILPSFRELLDQVDLSDDEQLGPTLSVDETELVEILRGILSASKGVKDMNEAWLVEASLSPAPHEVEDRARAEKYFTTIMTQLKAAKGEDPLGLHFVSALIDRVHDAGRLVWSQHRRILEYANKLRVELESLKSQRRDMEQEVRVLRSSLDGARNDRVRFEGDVLSLPDAAALLKAELKAEGPRAVAAYKASRGFESGLEKMRRVSYEFGYRVALERLRGRHPEIMIELDLFTECPNDANVKMDLN
ncbi:hypothetical protein BHE74_00057288 [Ensete ventricosum]|nr:hypothetical protein BHE74_00057288 [Ensete ventricosum]